MRGSNIMIAVLAALSLVGIVACALTGTPIPNVLEWTTTGSLGGLLGVAMPTTSTGKGPTP